MLIEKEKDVFQGGIADVICILKLPGGTFHVAFYEEHPMPGPVRPIKDLDFIRLKSKMHHTAGALTLEGAQKHLDDMRAKIKIPDNNVARNIALDMEDPVSTLILPNWVRANKTVEEVLQ